jgi:hypothetical protein
MVQIKIEPEPEYDLFSKVGSIDLEYGVKGRELEHNLEAAQATFVRSMEMRGLTLARIPGQRNPVWITDEDGRLNAFYAIDWYGERIPKHVPPDGNPLELAHTRETSLEETGGKVEYRVVGIFWGPKTSIEVLKASAQIKDEERLAKNPTSFGPGGIQLPGSPDYPGDDAMRPPQPRTDPRILSALERRQPRDRREPKPSRDQGLIDDDTRRIT